MDLSQEEIRQAIEKGAESKFPNARLLWVEATYDDSTVVCVCPNATAAEEYPPSEYYRLGYSVSDDGEVTLTGEPERVRPERGWVAFADRLNGSPMFFYDFGSYRWEKTGDTYAIRHLDIFKLGPAQGFNFDEAWADHAVATHAEMQAANGYGASIIKGHNPRPLPGRPDPPEKPAYGIMRNVVREGDTMFADFEGLDEATFSEIKAGRWPGRSVEVRPDRFRFSHIALLGATVPYHKLTPLTFSIPEGDDARENVMWFAWTPGGMEVIPMNGVKHNQGGGGGAAPKPGEPQNPPPVAPTQNDGVDPKQFAEAQVELEALKKQNARLAEQNRKSRVREFNAALDGLGIAPAVRDDAVVRHFVEQFSADDVSVKFAEGDEVDGLAGLGRLVTLFAEKAKAGALLVPPTGQLSTPGVPGHPEDTAGAAAVKPTEAEVKMFGEHVDPDTLIQFRLTHRLATAKNISFREAKSMIEQGQIDEAGIAALGAAK